MDSGYTVNLNDTYSYIDIEYVINGQSSNNRMVRRLFPHSGTQNLQGILNITSNTTEMQFLNRHVTFDGSKLVFNASYSKVATSPKTYVEAVSYCVPRRVYVYK